MSVDDSDNHAIPEHFFWGGAAPHLPLVTKQFTVLVKFPELCCTVNAGVYILHASKKVVRYFFALSKQSSLLRVTG